MNLSIKKCLMKNMEENKIAISIIVPVYNSEKYLYGLFDCIMNQTYRFFEVIIVDDGSCDKTSLICKEQCASDPRFKYFYKKNGGASSARNYGLKKASCDFILFIDSDDLISKDFVETFVTAYKNTKADIVSYKIFIPNEKKETKKTFERIVDSTNNVIDSFFKEELGVGPTSKLFQKSKLNSLSFDENLIINEDKLFLFEYLLRCSSAFVSFKTKYYVNHRLDSVSNSIDFAKKTTDLLYVHERIAELAKTNQSSFVHFKQHNSKNLLFIYKMYCRSRDFVIDYNDPLFIEIRKLVCFGKKLKGHLKVKTKVELFLFNHFLGLYTAILHKYYNHN